MSGPQRVLLFMGVLAILGSFMLVQAVLPAPRENLLWRSLFDAAHVPVFGAFALVMRLLLDWARGKSSILNDVLAVALTGALGLVTEFAQKFVGRDASGLDLIRDFMGAIALLLVARAITNQGQAAWKRTALVVVALVVAGVGLLQPIQGMLAYRQRDAAFPTLVTFDSGWTSRFIATRNVDLELVPPPPQWSAADVAQVARLTYGTSDYPAFIVREPHANWSDRQALVLRLFHPGDSDLVFHVRIDDAAHNGSYTDRYGGQITVAPGASEVTIPLQEVREAPKSREMNLQRIRSLTLFAAKPKEERVVYLSGIFLR